MTPVTMKDVPTTAIAPPEITIYGPHECPNCDKAMEHFDRKDIAYSKVDLEPGDANHVYVKDTLGYSTAPVIVAKIPGHRTVHWGGHRIDMLMALTRLCRNGIQRADENRTVDA
jgi:glutaredoxin-like protein NrdH